MKVRTFCFILALGFLLLLAACGSAPAEREFAASPAPGPFGAVSCLELSVKFFTRPNRQYRLRLLREEGSWSLRTADYPGTILEPGTDVTASGECREDLPFDRFLEVFRTYHAEAWDGWDTAGGEETFSLELVFADGSRYSASGGEAPKGFDGFREAFVREMARFGEEYGGVKPQTVQERLLNVYPLFRQGEAAVGIVYDTGSAESASLPVAGQTAVYQSSPPWARKNDLAAFLGDWFCDGEEQSWYRVKGLKGLKYLISKNEAGELRLWQFRYFVHRRSQSAMAEQLQLIYGVEGPEDIRRVTVSETDQISRRYAPPELWIEPRYLEDRESISAICDVFLQITWNGIYGGHDGLNGFHRHTYSFCRHGEGATMEERNTDLYLAIRKLELLLEDGTTIEGWQYDAHWGQMFCTEYPDPAMDQSLPEEDIEALNVLFGIA